MLGLELVSFTRNILFLRFVCVVACSCSYSLSMLLMGTPPGAFVQVSLKYFLLSSLNPLLHFKYS